MTKIKDVFEEIFLGINLSTCSKVGEMQEVYTFKKENIFYHSILYNDFGYNKFRNRERYEYLVTSSLLKIKVPKNMKEKYFLKYGDIIISLKKPYKVFNDIIFQKDKIVATNNYVILRKRKSENYYTPFLAYYIENVGIEEFLKENNKMNSELSIEDIKNIELPDISKKEQIHKYFEITDLIKDILKSENRINEILSKYRKNNQD